MRIINFLRPYVQTILVAPLRVRFLKIIPKGGVGAELGVFQGQFSGELIKMTQPQKIYLVDPWWKLFGEYFPEWANKFNSDKPLSTKLAFERVKKEVERVNGKEVTKLVVSNDVEFLKSLPDNSLDWAYIDSSHQYQHTKDELNELNRIIKPNGLITGHDWQPNPKHIHHGVCKAVNEFCKSENWKVLKIDSIFTQWAISRNS